MSSVLETIRRVFGRDRGQRPDPGASSEAALPPPVGASDSAMPSAAGEPTPVMPGDAAERPIQPTAPPPVPTSPAASTESPVAASAVTESTREGTEGEQVVEPSRLQSDDTAAEPLGPESVQDLPAPVGLVEETVQQSVVEEPLAAETAAAAGGQGTEIEESVHAIVVEEPMPEPEQHEQAVKDEPLAPAEASGPPEAAESLESAPAALPTWPEEAPEQQTSVESSDQDETR